MTEPICRPPLKKIWVERNWAGGTEGEPKHHRKKKRSKEEEEGGGT